MNTITQAKFNLHEDAEQTRIRPSVVIKITPEALAPCLEFMIARHFSFEVKCNVKENVTEEFPTQMPQKGYVTLPNLRELGNNRNVANEVYERYISIISKHPLPPIPQIAAEFKVPIQKLKASFHKTYGGTIYQTYMKVRMEKAAELLQRGYKANEVSNMVGYGGKSSIKFNKMFQKHFGITPKKYQQQVDID
ncbi:AraC-like DNA-binding protein [Runella defluvii]|uniref:AraC-like DNA-binding protein n=1 Tax=Runella defluvii TaxID=370973 RepID=A0A7W5ZUD8_9BACT|nr:AraC family transcriptional regulator [Runella defluvii]MBB3842261.1 AraC-like DNA-binding protein [Runella defluvii]